MSYLDNIALTGIEVRNKLDELEQKYGMGSKEYYEEYYEKDKSDELDLEGADSLRWATYWEVWQGGNLREER